MLPYQLTLAAEEDLKKIAHYTFQQWGKTQAMRYAKLLETAFHDIAANRALSRTFSKQYPQVQVTKCEHHYIFYISNIGELPCILAILHERMDLIVRLEDRLSL